MTVTPAADTRTSAPALAKRFSTPAFEPQFCRIVPSLCRAQQHCFIPHYPCPGRVHAKRTTNTMYALLETNFEHLILNSYVVAAPEQITVICMSADIIACRSGVRSLPYAVAFGRAKASPAAHTNTNEMITFNNKK